MTCSTDARLYVSGTLLDENDKSIIDRINPILNLIPLIYLNIRCEKLSTNMFIRILNCLPNLRSIRIEGFPFRPSVKLSLSTKTIWERFLENNQIEKLFLCYFPTTENVQHLLLLFPRIKYFTLQYLLDEDIQIFVRFILLHIHTNEICQLKSICLFTIEPQFDRMEKLKQMINNEKLLTNYSIHRQSNRFYLLLK